MNTINTSGSAAPRVRMTYEVQVGDATEERELPFSIGVLADLEGHASPARPLREKKFTRIDPDNFDAKLAHISPVLRFTAPLAPPGPSGETLTVDLRFRALADFEPASVAAQIPSLQSLLELRGKLDDLRSAVHSNDRLDRMIQEILLGAAPQSVDEPHPWAQEIEQIVQLGLLGRLEEEKNLARQYLDAFFQGVAVGDTIASPDTEAVLTERIGVLDEAISLQLNEIFHHAAFQRLEASWRGLYYLVSQCGAFSEVQIEVLPVSKKDLDRDMQRAVEFDETVIFKRVYDDLYGTYGGHPFAALIGDYEFDRSPRDCFLLDKLSNIAAAAGTPFIAAAAPELFGMESFTELSRPRDLSKIFDSTWYARWASFRASEDSRYTGLVLPRVLTRLPYGRSGIPAERFNYDERVDGTEHSRYLWGTAVWAFGVRLAEAFHRHGWCAAITGPERGGTVPNLPMHRFTSDEGDPVSQCPTEIAITDRRRGELERLGFIPLCYRLGSNVATFFEASSCQKPKLFLDDAATAKSRASAKLEYVFAASRFTHYLRCIVRDRLGTFLTRGEWEAYLKTWLNQFVLLDDHAPPDVKARYPLRSASLELQEIPGRPGAFGAVIRLAPHFHLTGQLVELRVTMQIASGF